MLLQGRYRIEKELGRGGFGAVYRTWDNNLNRPCAVKENLEISPEAQRQFMREATVLANLSHPNLPRVTDYFLVPDQGQYLVMDFVEGEDLASLIQRQGAVPLEQAVIWTRQILDALIYLHSRQPPVVHRDIKPANIRITPDGRAMLVDFGLVKMFDPGVRTTMGARAITPGYAPPEQYGRGATDPRTDIYALGATLFSIVTGKDPLESVQRMAGERMPPAIQIDSSIPLQISQAIEKAMSLEPGQRYQNAADFKAVLKSPEPKHTPVASTVVVPQPPQVAARQAAQAPALRPASNPISRPRKKNWLIWAGLGIVALLCVSSVLAVAWIFNDQQSRDAKAKEQTRVSLAVTQTLQNRKSETAIAELTAQAGSRETETAQLSARATAEAQAVLVAAANATATESARLAATEQAYLGILNLAKKWSVILSENFDQNSYGWVTGDNSGQRADITWTIANGVYSWNATAKEGFVWWVYPEMETYSDFYYAADLKTNQGPPVAEQGLVFRMQKIGEENSYYLFEVSQSQEYSVWFRDASGWDEMKPWTSSPLIRGVEGNRLAVVAQGNRLIFFINDQYLTEMTDDRLNSGKVGLCVGLDENGQTGAWEFDNLELRTP